MTFANFLTLSRLALVPFFLVALIVGESGWALSLFCIAGATDLIDGTVARKWSRPSKWGAILDPLADKCLVQSCFIALGVIGVLPWWFVGLAFARDIIIVVGIIYLEYKAAQLPYRPTIVSKFATLFQLLVAILALVMLWRPYAELWGRPLSVYLSWAVYVAAALVLASGIKYVIMGFELLKQRRAHGAS